MSRYLPTERMTHVAPDGDIPGWTKPWANIWVDQVGGMHWTCFTHGTTFEDIFHKVYGRPVGWDEMAWMRDTLGSVGDADDAEDDNPGWQFNELATRSLGWVRVKADQLDNAKPDFVISFDEPATKQALTAVMKLLGTYPVQSKAELNACSSFVDAMPRPKAVSEIREFAAEAPTGDATAPAYSPTPAARRF